MKSTRATLVWLRAAMKLADAVATHSATRDAREADGPERLHHTAAFDNRDVEQHRGAPEGRAPEDLGRRVECELALKDAGGRPRDRGERHVDLPSALAPRPFERNCRRRHAVKSYAVSGSRAG